MEDASSIDDGVGNIGGPTPAVSDPVLSGVLLKRSSRHRPWNERYFALNSGSTLAYYHPRKNPKDGASVSSPEDRPKRTFTISREAGCEISNMYVDQRQLSTGKQLLYCFKISWTGSVDGGSRNSVSGYHDAAFNDSFYGGRDDGSSVAGLSQTEAIPTGSTHSASPRLPDPKLRADIIGPASPSVDEDDVTLDGFGGSFDQAVQGGGLSLQSAPATPSAPGKSKVISFHHSLNSIPNIHDDHSIASDTAAISNKSKKQRHKRSWSKSLVKASEKSLAKVSEAIFPPGSSHNKQAPIPAEEERKAEVSFVPSTPELSRGALDSNPPDTLARADRVQRLYAQQQIAEQDLLREEFFLHKKENRKMRKKQLVQGTKLAAAAGAAATVAILTAGVGLVAGLAFVGIGAGAAASGGATTAINTLASKTGRRSEITMATPSYENAKLWKATLDAHLEYENIKDTTWGQLFVESGGRDRKHAFLPVADVGMTREFVSYPSMDESMDRLDRKRYTDKSFLFEPSTQWRPLEGWAASLLGTGVQGLRIFREEKRTPTIPMAGRGKRVRRIFTNLSVDGGTCAAMKAHVVLHTTPLDAFMCLMSYARIGGGIESSFCPQSEQGSSFRVIETVDDHMDIIHLMFRPIYLFPSWSCPRDFVLVRYWRFEPDGTYIVCYESVTHRDCPPMPGIVRGEMHQAYTISPRKTPHKRKAGTAIVPVQQECLMTAVVQVDPRGWVPISPLPFTSFNGYGEAFGIAALLQLLDIKDAIVRDRFVAVELDIESPTTHFRPRINDLPEKAAVAEGVFESEAADDRNYDFSFVSRESRKIQDSPSGLRSTPPPFLLESWAEPDPNSFRVRGQNYKNDRLKINAGSSIARLVAFDIVEVDEPIYTGLSTHPTERIQLALKKEKILKAQGKQSDMPPFMFLLNIVIPAEPIYHAAFYYAVDDMSAIDGTDSTPSSLLCSQFFFGDSDSFRDKAFKLIPQIVQGNFMVRKAVGSTPAIMGKKLRQLYVKDERFMEVILDCGSSSVAAGVIRLSLGYSKTLVVDLGFLLEGDEETVLPERILGCVRLKCLDFDDKSVRKVVHPRDL